MLTATVSGSFHRHLSAISLAVQELTDRGVKVLSPADPRVVDAKGDFLFVASDRVRSIRLVQDRHLECLRASQFLWLVTPDGYVGQSASMELGFAVAVGTPIFGLRIPADLTLGQYVHQVASIDEAIARTRGRVPREPSFLINPHATIEEAAGTLARITKALQSGREQTAQTQLESGIYSGCERLASMFAVPRNDSPLIQ